MAFSRHATLTAKGFCSMPAKINGSSSASMVSLNLSASRRINRSLCSAAPKFKGTQLREQKLSELIVEKVSEAKEVCEGNEGSDECKVAWDEVEEVSQAKAHFRQRVQNEDPLEIFCKDNPETDECRLYED